MATSQAVQARSDEAADARLAKLTDNEVRLEKRNAIRVLLAKRLGLKTHLETRNSSTYHLVVGKGGVKMQAAPAPPPPANGEAPPPPPPANVQAHGSQHGLEFVGSNASMRAITGALSSMVEAPVVDKTGLTGTYNYTLQFGREWSAGDPESWPSIFTAGAGTAWAQARSCARVRAQPRGRPHYEANGKLIHVLNAALCRAPSHGSRGAHW
jgi:uncharacterized protein (TIGR03435 family)